MIPFQIKEPSEPFHFVDNVGNIATFKGVNDNIYDLYVTVSALYIRNRVSERMLVIDTAELLDQITDDIENL